MNCDHVVKFQTAKGLRYDPSQNLQEFLLTVLQRDVLGTHPLEGVDVASEAEVLEEIERIPRAMFSNASVSSFADNWVPTRSDTYESSLEHCTRVGRQMDTDALGDTTFAPNINPESKSKSRA